MNHGPQIMGILNITPDSFYDGEKKLTEQTLLSKILEIKKSDIIDIGCESSRPGANPITVDEEIKRFVKIIPFLDHFDNIRLSIDTYKHEVAKYVISTLKRRGTERPIILNSLCFLLFL